MPFEPIQFWNVAQQLAGDQPTEAHLRTAVGRAYYAAFLRARSKTGVTGSRHVHKRVIGALKAKGDSGTRAAGDQLDRLEELRGFADYDLDLDRTNPSKANWESNWTVAKSLFAFIMKRL